MPSDLSGVVAIAAGARHTLALRSDGTVVGWGLGTNVCCSYYNDYGQARPPPGLSNVTAIAAGEFFSVAIKSNGTVVTWGRNDPEEIGVPQNVTDAVAIAAGYNHTLVLTKQGTLVTWGGTDEDYDYGQTLVPLGMSNIVAIAAKGYHSLVLRNDGKVFSWGNEQLDEWDAPITPKNLSNGVAIAAGIDYNLAVALNTAPNALPQQIRCFDNSETLIELSGSDAEVDPLSFRVLTLPSGGRLYQVTGNSRGQMITSTPAEVADPSGRLIFLPFADFIGYSSFRFASDDGQYTSAPATVEIRVVGAPFAITRPATFINPTTAQLNSAVTPNGHPTTVWFEWGLNSNYSNGTPSTLIGEGKGVMFVGAPIPDVRQNFIYHYRVVASNSLGIVLGNERTFGIGKKVWGDTNVHPDYPTW